MSSNINAVQGEPSTLHSLQKKLTIGAVVIAGFFVAHWLNLPAKPATPTVQAATPTVQTTAKEDRCSVIGIYAAKVTQQRDSGVPEAKAGHNPGQPLPAGSIAQDVVHTLYHEGRHLSPMGALAAFEAACSSGTAY